MKTSLAGYLRLLRRLALSAWSCCCFSTFLSAAENTRPPGPVPAIQTAFESTEVKLDAKPGGESAHVEWPFTNRWDFPLIVDRFEESCGCLSGVVDQTAVNPGKKGLIRATFTPGPYRGKVRKSLHVRFAGHEAPVELVAEVMIPSTVELSSRDLVWRAGDTGAQSIEIKAGTDANIRITDLLGLDQKRFAVEKEVVSAGRYYRLKVNPLPGTPPGISTLQVRTDSPDPRDQVLAVFVRVEADLKDSQPSVPTRMPKS